MKLIEIEKRRMIIHSFGNIFNVSNHHVIINLHFAQRSTMIGMDDMSELLNGKAASLFMLMCDIWSLFRSHPQGAEQIK